MHKRNWIVVLSTLSLVGLVACSDKKPTRPLVPAAQWWQEDFNGTSLNTAVWSVDNGDGAVVVANGVATLTSTGSVFPVATTTHDPFPAGNFRLTVRLRYLSVAFCGDGFGAMDNFWENYRTGTECRPFMLWQDLGGVYAYTASAGYTKLASAPETAYHIYEWRYVNGTIDMQYDGTHVSSGSCGPKPTALFFGHPHPVGCGSWTSFEIDYIHIAPL